MYYCYLNGKILPYGECNLHISDLQLQRGYGVFDFFRSRNGSIPWLSDYTDRLFTSVQLSGMDMELSRQSFTSIIFDLHQKNRSENGAFKVIITGGYSENLDTVSGRENIIILNVPWQGPDRESYDKGVNLITQEHLRSNPEIKTLNYFTTLQLRNKMKKHHAVDILFHRKTISEASRANLFFVKGGTIFTPANDILMGITRKRLLAMFGEIRVEDIEFDRLYDFDEMFLSSTSRDITPVVSVDGRKIGTGRPGGVTKEITEAFKV